MGRGELWAYVMLLLITPLIVSCGGGGGGASLDTDVLNGGIGNANGSREFTISSDVDATSVRTPYTVTWSISGYDSCSLSGAISQSETNDGFKEINPETAGEKNITITCGSESKSINIIVLPEYVDVPDVVFADALTRLGYPVTDGKLKALDALKIENIIITSKSGMYGETDSNGITTFENTSVPDYGAKVTYTPDGEYITDTTGIESFLNLKTMRLESQNFDEIDLSSLQKLTFISLWQNPILTLDVSNNTELTNLGLSETGLTTIDTSRLTKLVEAAFQQDKVVPYTVTNGTKSYTVNGFSSLDFSENINLQRIYLHSNPLIDFGIGENNKNTLTEVWAEGTDIATLDLSEFTQVRYVILNSNRNLYYLNLYGINGNQIPFRLYCQECPNLDEIIVTNVNNYQDAIEAMSDEGRTSSDSAIWLDDGITLIEGP